MSAAGVTLTRESICATCLSQDRKLFSVNVSILQVLFLNLSERDKLCWECNFFVLKVAAFRNQAARAQVLLNSALHSSTKNIKIASLSGLTTTPVSLGASLYTPDPLQIFLKAEPLKPVKEEVEKKNDECAIGENSCDETGDGDYDDEMANASLLPVSKRREAKGDESNVMADADKPNAKLKSLLSRKSVTIKVQPAKKIKREPIVSVEIEEYKDDVSGQKETKDVKEVKETVPIDPENIFTVTVLSEEEMLKWRERKKDSEYYTGSITAMRCKPCIEPFNSRKLTTAHARRHKENYGPLTCHICGIRAVSDKELRAHTAQHYRLLTCCACGFEWDDANVLRRHCHNAHGVPVTVWDCGQCERQFPTQRKHTAHMICHRVVWCRDCGKQLRQNNLKKHQLWHEGIPLRSCPVCGGQYRGDEGLASHMKTHDTTVDEAAFCADCNIQFRTMQLYRNHRMYTLKHARLEDMSFKCSVCSKAFTQRAMLKLHVDGVHSREPQHKCRVCGEMFKTRIAKRTHERIKHEGLRPARNKVCDHCGKTFTNKSTLQDHLNMHTGARPFACSLCDATFGYKSALYLHGRYKHKIKKKNNKKVEETTSADPEKDTYTPSQSNLIKE